MIRFLSLLCCSLILAGCTSDAEKAKQLLADSVVIKTDLEFHEVVAYPGDVVCGRFSAYLSYSEPRTEEAPFIVLGGALDKQPTDLDWELLCQKDPAAALFEESGIGPFLASSEELVKITRDMSRVSAALEAYYNDNSHFPSESEGLQALVSKPANNRRTQNYRDGGYIDAVPNDPWDRPYRYYHEQWAGVKGSFEIITLGKSGEPGGSDLEADVSSKYLRYLQRIARLLGIDLSQP